MVGVLLVQGVNVRHVYTLFGKESDVRRGVRITYGVAV
jgi:hypothetical protein